MYVCMAIMASACAVAYAYPCMLSAMLPCMYVGIMLWTVPRAGHPIVGEHAAVYSTHTLRHVLAESAYVGGMLCCAYVSISPSIYPLCLSHSTLPIYVLGQIASTTARAHDSTCTALLLLVVLTLLGQHDTAYASCHAAVYVVRTVAST